MKEQVSMWHLIQKCHSIIFSFIPLIHYPPLCPVLPYGSPPFFLQIIPLSAFLSYVFHYLLHAPLRVLKISSFLPIRAFLFFMTYICIYMYIILKLSSTYIETYGVFMCLIYLTQYWWFTGSNTFLKKNIIPFFLMAMWYPIAYMHHFIHSLVDI